MSAVPPLSVVTGAGSGIGLALVRGLLDRGHAVLAVDLDTARIDARAERHALDVRDAAGMAALAAAHAGRPLHSLFANAGVGAAGDVLTADDATWQWAWDVNVAAPLRAIRQWWPALAAGRGRVVATVSAAALQSYPGAGPYRASKAALLAALEGLHYQAAASGVRVHALCPGMVRTQVVDVDRYPEARGRPPAGPNPFADFVRAAIPQAEPAEAFAGRVLDGLEADPPFYWFTHDETLPWIEGRARAIAQRTRPFSDFAGPAR